MNKGDRRTKGTKRKDIKEIMRERERKENFIYCKHRRPGKNWVVKPDMLPEEASVKLSGFKFHKHPWPTQKNKYIRKTKKEQYIIKCIEKWRERVKLGSE